MFREKFESDLKNELYRVSQKSGFEISKNRNLHRTLVDFLSIRLKTIKQKKREVKFNPKFISDLIISPENPKTKAVKYIARVASNGGNLNIFQSKKIKQTNFFDHLSSEWNIFHFHLSNKIDPKSGFIKQGNTILFCYINDDTIIFLGTDQHRAGVFAEKKWIEIIYDHFNYILKPFENKNTENINPDVEGEELQMMWNKGYTIAFRKIRDKVYSAPGIGRATTGQSLIVSKEAISILRWLNEIILQVEDSIIELSEYLKIDKSKISLKIIIGNEKIELIEENKNTAILKYPEFLATKEEIKKMY